MGRDPTRQLEKRLDLADAPVAACAIVLVAVGLTVWPAAAWAYRPFDSTDAAVADKGVWEFEFSPLSFEYNDEGSALVSPAVRANYGIIENWELVAEGQVNNLTHGGSELSEAQLDAKAVLREGSLQEKDGPSIGTEFSILMPGIGTEDGAGFEWTGIVSQRWDWGTVHFNIAGLLSREQRGGVFSGLILEGPGRWPLRPVAELTYEHAFGSDEQYSGLVGAIWQLSEHSALDLGFRHGQFNSRPDEQIRAGVTFDL